MPEYRTRRVALTVAGQWRIFTAFPSIPLRDGGGCATKKDFAAGSKKQLIVFRVVAGVEKRSRESLW
jgi:hypothetical protein